MRCGGPRAHSVNSAPLRQVPEWTKCSSREKRKEKKVEKPFYSDSEGESGPTESADSGNSVSTFWRCSAVQDMIVFEFKSTLYFCPELFENVRWNIQ